MRMVILFILLLSNSFAQISQGGIPRYYDRDISIDFVEPNRMDLIDRNFLATNSELENRNDLRFHCF